MELKALEKLQLKVFRQRLYIATERFESDFQHKTDLSQKDG